MCGGFPTAGTWSSSPWRPDSEFETHTFDWQQGIDETLTRAHAFYAVVGVSIAVGIAMDFLGISAVKALYWTAVINVS